MQAIILIHSGKANLPEIDAYKTYFTNRGYKIETKYIDEVSNKGNYGDKILWFFMGFYPRKFNAKYIIHDYRSLSVGKFSRLKNFLKKHFQQKPDLRVFLNKNVYRELGFTDDVPALFLDMGVPGFVFEFKNSNDFEYDFIYVGDVSFERRIDLLIENFISSFREKKKLLIVGSYEKGIKDKYKDHKNIIFTGKVTQKEVFQYVRKTDICLSFTPDKYPHYFQTPTKLLEYAALGKKIIMSNIASNVETSKKFGINAYISDDFKFPCETELTSINGNEHIDYRDFLWEKQISTSGIEHFLPGP